MKPSIPKGTRDFTPSEVNLRDFVKGKIKSNFELFGFEPIETPSFEKLEVIADKHVNDGEQLIFKILSNGEKLSKADLNSLQKQNYSVYFRWMGSGFKKLYQCYFASKHIKF